MFANIIYVSSAIGLCVTGIVFRYMRLFKTKTKHSNPKILFYHFRKNTENPYYDEPTSISIYDSDSEIFLKCDDIHNDESFTEFCTVLKTLLDNMKQCYMITYDIDYKSIGFQNNMEDFIDHHKIKMHFMDIKQLFYYMHPLVGKIKYPDILEYYKIDIKHFRCKSLEYCAIFEQLILDFDPCIRQEMYKLHLLYNHLHKS